MKRIKNGNSTTENRLNHCMIFHAYCKKNRPAEPGRSFFFFQYEQFTLFGTKNLQSTGTYIFKRTWDPSQKAITK